MKDLDLGYNLVRTHDGKGAFVIVDHDELDPLASRAPMSTVYASGCPPNTSMGTAQHGLPFISPSTFHDLRMQTQ